MGHKLKKNAEHEHLSIVARVQIIVFFIILCSYFEVIVHETGAKHFFYSLTFKLRKKCVTDIINVFGHNLKKMQNMGA